MKDENKTKEQLIEELAELRRRVGELEAVESTCKQAEEAAERAHQELETIMDATPLLVFYKDGENRFVRVNKALAEARGLPKEQIEGKSAFDLFPEQAQHYWEDDQEVMVSGRPKLGIVETMEGDDGKTVWVETDKIPYRSEEGEIDGIIGFATDITARKQAEERLEEANTIINRSSTVAFTWKNEEGWPVEFVSDNVERLFGYTAKEFTSGEISYASCVHPNDLERVAREVERWSEEGRTEFVHRPYRIVTKDGMEKIISDWTFLVRDEEGNITHYKGTVEDITARKQVEEALQKAHDELERRIDERTAELQKTNEQLQQEIVENQRTEAVLRERERRLDEVHRITHLGHWDWNIQTNELYWSDEVYRIFGLSPQEFSATYEAFLERVHPEDRALVEQSVEAALQKKPYSIEHRIILPDGEEKTVHERGEVAFNEEGQLLRMLGTAQDITERKRMEEEKARLEIQLRQSQKMEAMGQLTAGITHNFNNMLMGILTSVEAVQLGEGDPSALLQNAEETTLRAANMIDQLMVFSRAEGSIETKPVNVVSVIQDAISICQKTFDRKIILHNQFSEDLPAIVGDAGQLEQVLLNLFVNARDALEESQPSAPCIRIEGDTIYYREEDLVAYSQANPGKYLRIEVSDNGIGMDEETRERIFEPFYTTKEVGQGTGLGLSTVYGIIQEHKGWIECDSQPGVGTTFRICIPVIEEEQQPVEKIENVASTSRGTETILVIEDEETVRLPLASALGKRGYTVLMGADGQEGLEIFQQEHNRIALVLLDWSMPRLSGQEVLAQLRELDPGVKVVILTGYILRDMESLEAKALLKKPCPLAQVLQTIRGVLDT